MKKTVLFSLVFFTAALVMVFTGSCSKPTENVTVEKALVGIWRFGSATISVTVDGEDFVDYAVSTFGLTEDEAQAVKEEIIDSTYNTSAGEIIFTNDKNFLLRFYNHDPENGTWSVGGDGETLYMNLNGEKDEFQILDLGAKDLVIQSPVDTVQVDLDEDGTNETSVELMFELTLSDVSNGGYGG